MEYKRRMFSKLIIAFEKESKIFDDVEKINMPCVTMDI